MPEPRDPLLKVLTDLLPTQTIQQAAFDGLPAGAHGPLDGPAAGG